MSWVYNPLASAYRAVTSYLTQPTQPLLPTLAPDTEPATSTAGSSSSSVVSSSVSTGSTSSTSTTGATSIPLVLIPVPDVEEKKGKSTWCTLYELTLAQLEQSLVLTSETPRIGLTTQLEGPLILDKRTLDLRAQLEEQEMSRPKLQVQYEPGSADQMASQQRGVIQSFSTLHKEFEDERELLDELTKEGKEVTKSLGSLPANVTRSLANVQTALLPSTTPPATTTTTGPTNVLSQEKQKFTSLTKDVATFRARLTKYQDDINVENKKVADLRLRYKQIINNLWLTDAQVNKDNVEIIATYRTLVDTLTTLRTNIISLNGAAKSIEADLATLKSLLGIP